MSVATVESPILTASRIFDLSSLAEISTARENILVVDHLPKVRSNLVKELSPAYNCSEANSAIEAMSRLREETFSVIITETMLPGLSGIELLRSVVRDFPDTAVIILSDVDRPQRALDAVRLGAFDYLIKPCEPIVLQMTIERAIERRRLMIDARRYKQDLELRNIELEEGKRELQRLQAQIVHSEKMASLGQLAAGIAHELNNPVGFVYGNLDLLKEKLEGLTRVLRYYDYTPIDGSAAQEIDALKREINYDESKKELDLMINDCLDGAVRIRDIVQNLRTFSHLDEAELKRTNIHLGIDSTLRILSKYFSAENLALVKDYGDLPEVDAFPGQLNQVWMNLLANAAQAIGKSKGEVRIETRALDGMVKVSVSDTGPGIPLEYMGKIFDPFFTTKAVGEGAGLGLSISFGIIERHGGQIDVINRPGVGATFMVQIPIDSVSRLNPESKSHTAR